MKSPLCIRRNLLPLKLSNDEVIDLFSAVGQDHPIASTINNKEVRLFARLCELFNGDITLQMLPADLKIWATNAFSFIGGPGINGHAQQPFRFDFGHQRNVEHGLGNTVRDFIMEIRVLEVIGRIDIKDHYRDVIDELFAAATVLKENR